MNNSLKRRVMTRIYLEYTKNLAARYPDYVMFFLFMVVSFSLVSFPNVLANLPKDNFISAFYFAVDALQHTKWIIQALIAGFFVRVLVSTSLFVYRKVKSITNEWMVKFGSKSNTEIENGSF